MATSAIIAQLRTTDLDRSIAFYTGTLGLELAFRYRDFYAGIRAGQQMLHLKLVDTADPSIAFVQQGDHFHLYVVIDDLAGFAARLQQAGVPFVKPPHDTPWGTRELAFHDDQGHTIYAAQEAAAAP